MDENKRLREEILPLLEEHFYGQHSAREVADPLTPPGP